MNTDRRRKLHAYFAAVIALGVGLLASLAAAVWKPDLGLMLAGLLVPYITGVGAALHLFIAGNVKVHQVGAEPPPGGQS